MFDRSREHRGAIRGSKLARTAFVALGLCLGAAGCSAESGTHGDSEANEASPGKVLYALTLQDGNRIAFYELMPGLVAIANSTPPGAVSADERYDLTGPVVDVFKRLKPDASVPEVLLALGDREAARSREVVAEPAARTEIVSVEAPRLESAPPDDAKDPVILKHNGHEAFESSTCTTSVLNLPNDSQRIKAVDTCALHRTSGALRTVNNLAQAYGAARSYRGTITFTTRWRNYNTGSFQLLDSWNIPQGGSQATRITQPNSSTRYDLQFEVSNATDDGYHRSVVVDGYVCAPNCRWDGFDRCLCGI